MHEPERTLQDRYRRGVIPKTDCREWRGQRVLWQSDSGGWQGVQNRRFVPMLPINPYPIGFGGTASDQAIRGCPCAGGPNQDESDVRSLAQ